MKKVLWYIFDADSIAGRILCSLLYTLFYDFMYRNIVYELFSYMEGLDYMDMSPFKYFSWIVLSVLPMTAYQRISNTSSFLCLFLYLFVYIPFVHGLFTVYGIDDKMLYSYTGVLCVVFIIYFCFGRYFILFKDLDFSPTIPFIYIEVATLLMTMLFIAVRGSSMHFVNIFTQLDVLYESRSENAESLGARNLILYVQGWLNGAFYPFLLVCYLNQKNYIKTGLVFLGYILLFMADMQKITFLMPFVLLGLYYLIKIKEDIICSNLHSYISMGLAALSFGLYFIKDSSNEIVFTLIAFVLLRTVCVVGWLTQTYFHFFQDNPYTYYSHIGFVNAITGSYPYDQPLGYAVSYGFQNANANLFLTDGFAAGGLIGIILISILFLIILLFINSISYKYKTVDLIVIFLPTLAFLLNVSLFTTFLSDGLFILLVLLLCTDSPISNGISNNNFIIKSLK